jgi:Zn-dependent M28 family amino/carboxypeptidase
MGALIVFHCACLAACTTHTSTPKPPIPFDGEAAYALVVEQLEFGPRIPGSAASAQAGDWILAEASRFGWQVEEQAFVHRGLPLRNLIAKSSLDPLSPIVVATHYDTRPLADRDASAPLSPVPGANDGASGTAVLLEIARVLNRETLRVPLWLVFFDAEDSGNINEWDWVVGSQHFTSSMAVRPSAAVIVDMVGDADLQLYLEGASDPALAASLWSVAEHLQVEAFIPEPGRTILDDHVPFLQLGVPAVLIIDIDYPYWHTMQDTADKVSPASLEQVGRVLQAWLGQVGAPPTPFP